MGLSLVLWSLMQVTTITRLNYCANFWYFTRQTEVVHSALPWFKTSDTVISEKEHLGQELFRSQQMKEQEFPLMSRNAHNQMHAQC